jgi:protein-histidine pros-kinase
VAAREILGEVARTLRPIAMAKGLDLCIGPPADDLVVTTDRRALSQILLNLGNNACKFTERGTIRLEAERVGIAGRAVAFRVSDTGIGIRDEDRARLFQAFVQLGREDGGDRNGSGLGLHLSQKLAELLGGRITVESEFGRGSRFTLTLGED